MDTDETRKEALRKKGQEFLEKAISQASTKASSAKLGDVKIAARDSITPLAHLDPALETVGVVVEGLKDYIAALVFVISSAASLVLAKATLTYLNTPATAVFLHMLSAVVVLLGMSAMGEFTLGPYSWASLRQCSAEVICSGLQVAMHVMVNKKRPRALIMLLAVIGVILAGAQCVGNRPHHVEDRSTTGSAVAVGLESDAAISVVFMMLWVAAEAGRGMLARALGTVGGLPLDANPLSTPPNKQTIAMYKNTLAALPVLVVGLVFKEGVALMRLELSVPTLTCLLLSCVAWGLAGGTQMVMQANTQQGFQLLMASLSHIGIVVAQIAVFGVGSVLMLLLASAGVSVAVAMLWAHQL